MRAAVFEGPGRLLVREVDLASCGPRDVVARVHACGICGSDIRNFRTGLKAEVGAQVMGHELTAVVTEVGAAVERFRVGDRIAVAPDVCCGECFYCRRGLVNLCLHHRMVGTHWPGGFAEYLHLPEVVLSHGMVHHVPAELSLDDAALSEPASSVIAAQENAGVGLGDTVLVIGDGPIGCLHLEVARARGAARVILAGLARVHEAERFAPDLLVDAGKTDTVEAVRTATGGLGADVAIVATPVAQTQAQAVRAVRKRGKVVLFGGLPKQAPETTLDSNLIHYGEIVVMGAFSYPAHVHQKALATIAAGRIHPAMYFNLVVGLDQVLEGFQAAAEGRALKVLVKP
ncbi:MAG TPA: alcohol dehydrogenase catalytic domain-containing protein [Anaeromyxobacter sp.]|nr:alcohol dehydrogenase catalytic domain-containing protein [Anaeromyxobacter sp.]